MASLRGETGSDGLRETVHRRLVGEGLLPGRLDQIRILTAKALLDRDSSTSDSEERNCSASPPSAGLRGCGCHGSVVLVGRLVAAIGDRPSSDYHALPSELAFCDSTAKIPCFVTSVSPALLDRDVVVVHWNFVKASPGRSFSPGYLEIGWVVPLSNDCEADRRPTALSAFTADDASFLQANRRVFGNRRLINVIGEVSAVSHPFRLAETTVGSVCLRDAETSRQVIVLNRDVKKLHWHPLLRLQKQYAFTDLEPTTLFPRDEKRTDVLQVTKGSKCYAAWEVSDCTAIVSVPDYLRSEGVDEELYVAWKRAAADALFAHPVNCSMFNFQGTITRDSWSDVGFFELDGSIRLHLGNVADVANFRHLRVGTKVTLYNVHVLKSHQKNFCEILREEFRWRSFGFDFSDPAAFYRSQWRFPRLLFVLFRLALALYTGTICILTLVFFPHRNPHRPWIVWLTNWSYLLLTSHEVLSAVIVCVHSTDSTTTDGCCCRELEEDGEEDKDKVDDIHNVCSHGSKEKSGERRRRDESNAAAALPFYMKLSWMIYCVASPVALIIFLTFVSNDALNLLQLPTKDFNNHVMNGVVVLLEVCVAALPVRLLHVVYVTIYYSIYYLFAYVFWSLDHTGNVLYPGSIDWNEPRETMTDWVFAALLRPMGIQILFFLVYRLKVFITTKVYGDEE